MLKLFLERYIYYVFGLWYALIIINYSVCVQEIKTQVLEKNQADFAITAHALVPERNAVVLGTNSFEPDKRFTLSYVMRMHTKPVRFTPEYVYVNGNKDKRPNPLYGASISHITPFGHALAVATNTQPTHVYFTTWPYDQTATVVTTDIMDDEKDPEHKKQKIAALVSNIQWSTQQEDTHKDTPVEYESTNDSNTTRDTIDTTNEQSQKNAQNKAQEQKNTTKKESALFVGLTGIPNKLTLGLLLLDTVKTKEEVDDEETQEKVTQERTEFVWRHTRSDTRRVPLYKKMLTLDSPEISSLGPLSALDSRIDIYYDATLDRVYYALTLTTGDAPEACGCGLLVGTVAESKLCLAPIAPATVFTSDHDQAAQVLGARGARKQVAIERVRTLHTSAGYAYCIVGTAGITAGVTASVTAGDIASETANKRITQQGVYAFGLVNARDKQTGSIAQEAQEFHGTLAHTQDFSIPARQPHESALCTDPHVQVGAGKLLPGPITDIQVSGEAVFVSVAHAERDQVPGIFHSQALLDSEGKIMAWTPWRRTASITDPVQSFIHDAGYGMFWYLTPQARSLKHSHWGTQTWNMQRFISQELMDNGGVQGARSFYHATPGFNQELGKRMSLLVLTGVNTVILAQTGFDAYSHVYQKQLFKPSLGTRIARYTQGTITHIPDNTQVVLVSGGALRSLGALTQAEIVSDGLYAWLVVAGAKGLAVLARADGTGWPVNPGLSPNFNNLPADMSFKVLGDYKGIRRISACDNRLYILTHEKLERVLITQQSIKTGRLEPVILKSIKNYRYFSDMCVLEPLIVVAGNEGLSCSGTNISAATASCQADMRWKTLALPNAVGPTAGPAPTTRLYRVSSRIGTVQYSTIYVLNGYVLGAQSQVYRYAVACDTSDNGNGNSNGNSNSSLIKNNTMQPILGDTYFFTPQGEYRNFIAADGSLLLASRSARPESSVLLELWPWSVNTKTKQLKNTDAKRITLSEEAHSIGRLAYDDALGTWLIYGEFGILLPG